MIRSDSETNVKTWIKLGIAVALAVLIAFSWIGVGYLIDDPTSIVGANPNPEAVQEDLTEESNGDITVTAVWATEEYFSTVDVTPENLGVDPGDDLVFIVFLDTHVGQLPQVDWTEAAELHTGGEQYAPVSAERKAGGYHHSTEVVVFDDAVLDENPDEVTLVISGGSLRENEDRTLTWEYPPR